MFWVAITFQEQRIFESNAFFWTLILNRNKLKQQRQSETKRAIDQQ